MQKQFTLETRLSLDDDAKKYLNEYVAYYNMISRNMWQIVKKSDFKELYTRSDFNTITCNKYNVLKRTANSIYTDLLSKKNSLLELNKTQLNNYKIRYSLLENKKEKLKEKINKLKAKVTINKTTNKELIRYRNSKQKYYYLCNRINHIKQKINNLEANIANEKISLAFGGKKIFKAQYNLEANNYKTSIKWKNTYKKKRDKNIFYLGSKDETNGNQLAQLSYSTTTDDFSLKLRKEKNYEEDSKYLTINNINIKYMKNELIQILNNHINKENQLPLSYRIYRKNNKWYLQVIITIITNDYDTRSNYGVIGLDFNSGFISLSETNESGNLVNMKHYPLKYHGGRNKALNEILNTINKIVTYAHSVGKDISIENLNFKNTKAKSISSNNKYEKSYNKMIHTLDYSRYIFCLENKCHKLKVSLNKIEPFYTSKIGYEKYSKERKLTIHQASSFVIARRYQGFKDRI